MTKREERRPSRIRCAPLRATIVGAVAFVLLIQIFAAVGAAFASKRASGETTAANATAFERFCAAGKSGHANADHSPSCMLCCSGRDASAPPPRLPYAATAPRRPIAGAPSTFSVRFMPSLAPESGWASSWSSQAPPAHS